MNLGDLLLELRENILHDRSDQVAGSPDYLWSDTTLVRYIDEAQRRLARQTLIIRDGTTPQCCQITLVAPDATPTAGQIEYPMDPSVLAVLSARLAGDHYDLARAGHSALDTYRTPDTRFFDPSQLSALQPGKPLAFATDEYLAADPYGSMGVPVFRVFPAPTNTYAGQAINMRVIRLPINRFALTALNVYPEVPEDYHLLMLDWAAYLALRIVDADGGDPERAEDFGKHFEAQCLTIRREVMRKLFTPAPWAFGRNGFSWQGN
jgi:hypothetical protein